MILPFRSIRWRIQAWHGLLLLVVLTGFGLVAHQLQKTSAARAVDAELQLRASALLGNLANQPHPRPPPRDDEEDDDLFLFQPQPAQPKAGPPPGSFQLRPELAALFAEHGEATFYYRIWSRTGGVLGGTSHAPSTLKIPARPPGHGLSYRSRDGRREAIEFTPPGECLVVGVSEAMQARETARFAAWLAGIGVVILGLGLAGGWWLASRAIAPIDAINAAAARIATGRLDERIRVTGKGSELDQLAAVLNHTFAQLDAAFAEQARFTSDAAHELRTPVSVVLAQTQLALARPRDAAEYRDSIEITRRAAVRMQGLIESLLTLARLDARSEPLRSEVCDLAVIAWEQLDLIRPLADERGIVLHPDLASAVCRVDPGHVAQIFVNLLSNAVKYSHVGGEVRLSSSRVNGHAVFRVSDTGPGIPAEHLPHLFERFYRADASRNRNTGGAGLGLAICKTLTEAQGGTLEVSSVEAQGSTFTLTLPAHPTGAVSNSAA